MQTRDSMDRRRRCLAGLALAAMLPLVVVACSGCGRTSERARAQAKQSLEVFGKGDCSEVVGAPFAVVAQRVQKGVGKTKAEELMGSHKISPAKDSFDIERDFGAKIICVTCELSGPKGSTAARVYMMQEGEDMIVFGRAEIEPIK